MPPPELERHIVERYSDRCSSRQVLPDGSLDGDPGGESERVTVENSNPIFNESWCSRYCGYGR